MSEPDATWSLGTAQDERLQPVTLREQARQVIRANIISGVIEPEVIHSVPSIAQRLGVSATPVREAMIDLSREGLVEVVRNRGFRIPRRSDKELDEIFELRLLLELPACSDIAGRLSEAALREMRSTVDANIRSVEQPDLVEFLETDRQFHLGLIAAHGNSRLTDTVTKLRDQSFLSGLEELALSGQLKASALEHLAILEAVESGASDVVRSLVQRHLEHTRGIWVGRRESEDR